MSTVFEDRRSTYPNRYQITPINGAPYYAVLERADEPIVAGTPLNAETLNGVVDAILAKLPMESAVYPGCYYRNVGGETEWINPPMIPNVPYRTSERSAGKAVYVKRIVIEELPNQATGVYVEIDRSDNPYVVDVRCTILAADGSYISVNPFNYWSGGTLSRAAVAIVVSLKQLDDGLMALELVLRAMDSPIVGGRVTLDVKYTLGGTESVVTGEDDVWEACSSGTYRG